MFTCCSEPSSKSSLKLASKISILQVTVSELLDKNALKYNYAFFFSVNIPLPCTETLPEIKQRCSKNTEASWWKDFYSLYSVSGLLMPEEE